MSTPYRLRVFGVFLACLLASALPALSQGVQTGTISGLVSSTDHVPLPGVAITVVSPALQGEREVVSDSNGVYYVTGLPAGTYRVEFAISGFQSAAREGVQVSIGAIASIDATMSLESIKETVTVTAQMPSPLAQASTTQAQTRRDIDVLPVGRRPVDVAELAPSVTTNTFNTGQLTVAGSFGYDNVFMVNGVDVNDNVQGTSNNLFIEDAIEDTSVLTHGISAEYGRFSGGVINVVTKSGGNRTSGSFRETLSNPAWIEETPLEKASTISHASVLGATHEGTVGGPVLRDRLWYFTAGRYEKSNMPNTFAQSGGAYTRTDTNRRGEVKLTSTFLPAQTVQASYINNATEQANASPISTAALLDAGMLTTRQLPNRLFGANYNGQLTPSLFATVQFSDKHQSYRHNGGTSGNIIDSPFVTMGATAGVPGGLFYHAPYLDATDPEQRNNQQIAGSLTHFAATPRFGSHELKGGGEYFVSTGIGGNSQSSTGYVFAADYLTANGTIVRDASGAPIPVFTPGVSEVWSFQATRGAQVRIKTTSLYVQDRWVAMPRLTLDLGTRFEAVRSDATGGIRAVNAMSIVPRLAASFDLQGNGDTVLYGTYSHYSGKYSQVQFAANTNVGRPSEVDYAYSGPAGQGLDFGPAFDLANYTEPTYASFPTANVQIADGIRSPLTREFTVGLGRELGDRGHAKATYAWRSASQFVEDFLDLSRGVTDVPLVGALTNRVYDNTDALYRDYQAVIVQSGYRLFTRLKVDGNYTLQLRNNGTFSGEASNQPGIPSIYGNFPEIFGPALDRLMPEGRLDNYQQHKLRVAATYEQSLGRFGSVDVAPLWRVNSGGVYSLTSAIRVPAAQLSRNPGYPTTDVSTATRETVYFGDRGGYDFKGYGVMDLATSYNLAVWKSARPWVKLEVYNLFNNQKQIAWDKTVSVDAASALDANGIATGYRKGAQFGQPTNGNQFPQPYLGQNGGRAARIAFGARF
jgi:hypothetical protein